MPKTIQDAVATARLQEEFALVGGFNLQLDETVVPVTIIKDIEVSNWRDCFQGDSQPLSGAGSSQKWGLRNPPGSGILAELYELGFSSTAVVEWEARVQFPPFIPGTIITPQFQDLVGEFGTPQQFPACQFRENSSAAALTGSVVFATSLLASTPHVWRPKVILHPGDVLNLAQVTQNVDGQVWFQWRERPLRPTEQR